MSKTIYQSEFKTVLIETNWDTRTVRMHLSTERESMSSWYRYNTPAKEVPFAEESELYSEAELIAPIFHGSHGPVLQVGTISTGAF